MADKKDDKGNIIVKDPGQIIDQVLNAANNLGLEMPATIANFSRSQLMLQNVIDNINNLNKGIRLKLSKIIESTFMSYFDDPNKNISWKKIEEIIKAEFNKLNKESDESLTPADQKKKAEFSLALEYFDILWSDKKLQHISFAEIILNIVHANKLYSTVLAGSDALRVVQASKQFIE